MADETRLDPPPPALTDTPRKPWVKPTVRVIGETIHDIQAAPTPEMYELGAYNPQS